MTSWANVANLHFTQVTESATNVGDLRFAYTDTPSAQAWAYTPDNAAYAGDVWFGRYTTSYIYPWTLGSYEYQTAIHEIGHALGLKHPFEASTLNSQTIDPSLDSRSFTVMSYSAQPGNSSTYFSYEPTTPMILDIAAIQSLYGVNTQFHAGDNLYSFGGTGNYHQTIWDAGGNDTIQYTSTTGGTIDLRSGVNGGSRMGNAVYVQDSNGHNLYSVGNVWIADGAIIENAIGGSGNDKIIGNDVANVLNGGSGVDTLSGGLGNDTLNGGTGADSMAGGVGDDTYYVDNVLDVVTENAAEGTDKILSSISFNLAIQGTNVENLTLIGAALNGTGNELDNTLIGNAAANLLDGGLGADSMNGGLGNDVYIVDNAGDTVTEAYTYAQGGGIDLVKSSVSFTLGANL
ncbi:M10 family metallopeptidase, partial [Novimethylophilus kurashikiensis]|uniref:M10 family metallopeptidase n=1 Tax=Novimethylophilus kurashikiensis TaxID=1825523 RepID=UPI0015E81051